MDTHRSTTLPFYCIGTDRHRHWTYVGFDSHWLVFLHHTVRVVYHNMSNLLVADLWMVAVVFGEEYEQGKNRNWFNGSFET